MSTSGINVGDRVAVQIGRNEIQTEVVALLSENTLKVRNLTSGKEFVTSYGRIATDIVASAKEAVAAKATPTEASIEEAPAKGPAPRRQRSLTAIAREVLEAEQRPLSVTELLDLAEQRGIFEPSDWGKTPGQTLYSAFVRIAKANGWVRKGETRGKWELTPAP